MKVYISGAITGIKNYEKVFAAAEQFLIDNGYEVVNPVTISHEHDKTWHSYMKEDLKALLECDSVCMLPGWNESKGANIEYQLAKSMDMPISHLAKDVINKRLFLNLVDMSIAPMYPKN